MNRVLPAYPVLDHGFVRLIDYMGNDLSVVRAARISYDAEWRAGADEKSDTRLIRYLWKNHHTTPFEAVTFTFEVYAPIFVLRQWHRHRTQSYNELSARYKELPEKFYLPSPENVGSQSTSNKQGRTIGDETLVEERKRQIEVLQDHCRDALGLYRKLIQEGWPRELARLCLPVNMYSHMFCTMNLLNFLRFATLRTHEHAQWEIRQYADNMVSMVSLITPECINAWREFK